MDILAMVTTVSPSPPPLRPRHLQSPPPVETSARTHLPSPISHPIPSHPTLVSSSVSVLGGPRPRPSPCTLRSRPHLPGQRSPFPRRTDPHAVLAPAVRHRLGICLPEDPTGVWLVLGETLARGLGKGRIGEWMGFRTGIREAGERDGGERRWSGVVWCGGEGRGGETCPVLAGLGCDF